MKKDEWLQVKRITALAIFFRGCNQSNPSSVRYKSK